MKVTNKPEQKNITQSKLDNKVPTKCPLEEDNKHELEDITGVIQIKYKNALNDKKQVTTLSKITSNSHADSILEEDEKSEDRKSKPGKGIKLTSELISSITQSPINDTNLAKLAYLACILMNKKTDLDNTSVNTAVGN